MEKLENKIVVEREPKRKILGRLTVTRHSKTEYTEVYPDITKEGEEIANRKADEIAAKNKKNKELEERFYFSSPRPRAKSTADIIKDKLGDKERPLNESDQIRATDFYDRAAAEEIFSSIAKENGGDPVSIMRAYRENDKRLSNPDVMESRDSVRKRVMRAMEYLIRSFEKRDDEKIAHIFATGHFELVDSILAEIFESAELFGYVDSVEFEFLESDDKNLIPIIVHYKNENKEIKFDRKKRKLLYEK